MKREADRYGGFGYQPAEGAVDRSKACPFLLRCFVFHDKAPDADLFVDPNNLPEDFHVYTWRDATLRELTELVKEVDQPARRNGAILEFYLAFPSVDDEQKITMEHVGNTTSVRGERVSGRRFAERRTLSERGFEIGDYLAINVISAEGEKRQHPKSKSRRRRSRK